MKITVLSENTCQKGNLPTEHGLSLYIETENHKILFDTGQTDLFQKNAEALGIDLREVDIAIISHGHYDHTGGLLTFLEVNKTAPVYLSRYAFEPHYNGQVKYIGMDSALKTCPRLIFTSDFLHIDNELSLHSCNQKERFYDMGSFGLNTLKDDVFVPDDFCHEQYLLIKEKDKEVLISGCSHKGILNIVRWFFPDVLVGGFHFSGLLLDDTLKSFAESLDSCNTEFYTCHCTGTDQYRFMKSFMDKLFYLSTGDCIIV